MRTTCENRTIRAECDGKAGNRGKRAAGIGGTSRLRPGLRTCARSAFLGAGTVVALALSAAAAKAGAEDKSRYTLFDPTPDRLLRDLTTDRPDTTESPFTVDAGHVQIETNLFGYTRSRPDADGTKTSSAEFATTNLRIGLTNATEVNVVWQPYGIVRSHPSDPADATRNAGIGGVDLRAKINLWGNDAFETPGATAFGLLPYITLPTKRGNGVSPDDVSGGLILPFAVVLTDKFELGLNTGVSAVRNEGGASYRAEWLASASLSYALSETIGTYYEIAGRFGTQNPLGDIVVLGTGVTYRLGRNLQLDGGVNFGVTNAADRINPFVGVTARF